MKKSDFYFELPDSLIAHYPPVKRTDSRLLCLNRQSGELAHQQFTDLLKHLRPEDLLVFNNTRVIPARLFGHKDSGGRVEVMVERLLPDNRLLAQVRTSKKPGTGASIHFTDELSATVEGREGQFFILQFGEALNLADLLDEIGHMPLPPYIKRNDEALDRERYQTVYSSKKGAVAAPTAGLHFDTEILARIKDLGVESAFVTLHVGAGTFQPVRSERIEEHRMHSEYLELEQAVCDQVRACRKRGGRVIAVGTTSVRCLETASQSGDIKPYHGDTDIFIYPGYEFRSVDALLTNFHLPESTLIMLVSAFAGRDAILNAYHEAVLQQYRFFSYGDAMFIY